MPIAHNRVDFINSVRPVFDRYVADNDWLYIGRPNKPSWYTLTNDDEAYGNAWKVYRNSKVAGAGRRILLGDTKLRSMPEFASNFGFIADSNEPGARDDLAKGALDKIGKAPYQNGVLDNRRQSGRFVAVKQEDRLQAWDQRKAGQKQISAGDEAISRVKNMPGSILTANDWHPLLNDSLVLGGAHGKAEFYYVPATDNELATWDQFRLRKALQARPIEPKNLWLIFFQRNLGALWNSSASPEVPRVLTREILGLCMLGYVPIFNENQLGFLPSSLSADKGHKEYLDALEACGFGVNNKELVLAAVGKYLFGDEAWWKSTWKMNDV